MKVIPINCGPALAALMRRRRAEFPPDAFEALDRAVAFHTLDEARGICRTASVLWRVASQRTGDRDLWRAAKAAFDIAECKQVVTAGEDL